MITTPGKYAIDPDEYHADPCPQPSLSRSTIKTLLDDCPFRAYWEHPRLNPEWVPEEPEAKFEIGQAFHDLLLRGIDTTHIVQAKDWRTGAARQERELARKDGRIPLLAAQYEHLQAMVEAGRKNISECLGIDLAAGESEVAYVWMEGPVWCRALLDHVSHQRGIILDVKSTSLTANPEGFARRVLDNGLDIQAEFYLRGLRAVDGLHYDFVFMVQEVAPPYLASFLTLDMFFSDMGRQKVESGIRLWRSCLAAGRWPTYPAEVYTLEPPGFALAQWEVRKAQIGGAR